MKKIGNEQEVNEDIDKLIKLIQGGQNDNK